jgi:phosphoribosylpyrophosphate synthetase
MVVSPDVGGVVRARALAKRIDARSPSSTSAATGRASRK